jgi:uncharacterized membrane protein YbhN (UPF0104 family)
MTRPALPWLRLGLSLVLGAAFVVALAPWIDAVPRQAEVPGWVVPAYLAALVPFHLLRAGRWWWLVRPVAPLGGREALLVGLAGYMWIALLPLRLGELARPLLVAQRANVPPSRVLGAIAVERVVDGLVVCAIFFAVVGDAPRLDIAWLRRGALAAVGLLAAVLVALLVAAARPELSAIVVHATVGRVAPRLATTVAGFATRVSEGLAVLGNPRALVGFLGSTAGYWIVNALGTWLLARGCGLPLSPLEAAGVMAVMNLVLLVPGGPAQLGVFQTGATLGLALWLPAAMLERAGSVFVFDLYVCQLATITLAGVLAHWRLRVGWRAALGVDAGGGAR